MNFILPKVLNLIDSKSHASDAQVINNMSIGSGFKQMKQMGHSQNEDLQICKEALQMIKELKRVTQDDNLHLILPMLIRVFTSSNYNEPKYETELKIDIVKTVNSLILCKSYREYIATIVHSMLNVLEVYQTNANELQ